MTLSISAESRKREGGREEMEGNGGKDALTFGKDMVLIYCELLYCVVRERERQTAAGTTARGCGSLAKGWLTVEGEGPQGGGGKSS